tara:strand:+ start:6318 stop:6959 length:642 start_codon:yes stop_codon:yes gene_type:complete
MSRIKSPEEIREECIAQMGENLGELYDDLRNQLTWIHLKWNDYESLFADTPEVINLLNKVAPAFFHNTQRMMIEDVVLHICRITDNVTVAGNETLTVKRFSRNITDRKLKNEVDTLVENAIEKCKFARVRRNRRLAHREMPLVGGRRTEPLPETTRQKIREALTALDSVLNRISQHYLNSTTAFSVSMGSVGGVDALLSTLWEWNERSEEFQP